MNDKSSSVSFNAENLQNARRLRREMTRQEKRLWYDFLKSYPVHFYRQRPIDRYIVDFYCPVAGLVIELDGEQHGEDEAVRYDGRRSEKLAELGLEVARFANGDVTGSFSGVCYAIHEKVKERLQRSGNLSSLDAIRAYEKDIDFT